MIIEETINGLLFQEQRTFYIYESEEKRSKGEFTLACSEEEKFLQNKKLARQKEAKQKEAKGDKDNKFIVL